MIITYSTYTSKHLQASDYRIRENFQARKFCIFPCKFAECKIFTLEKKKKTMYILT